ncbi:hypothetical protein OU787_17720 [Kitasatospora sp. YST-16]|uniref:hypothetical protein n=1 Tax=Kitasatospora sp. YST-16 TaxID=2998080 RepID=UPI0022850A1A|nr:hypothetical protein [Kitasatospora sp. YST-16]WAL73185.1 hypothetical protein OU787_17720 [Kitasatospora sp. YST-16]WNW39238.1 hypothetical protein RKE32_17680 [Streptomyces sp. Li-HN-5-13]
MSGRRPLVLIEPRGAGHSPRVLADLAAAVSGRALAVLLGGTDHDTAAAIASTGARLVVRPSGAPARVLWAAARTADCLAAAGIRATRALRLPRRVRRVPHQGVLLARCLAEAAHLATARAVLADEPPGAVVVLTAGEALHHTTARLGRLPHLRFVHEVATVPARFLQCLDRPGGPAVRVLCPTEAVRADVQANAPRVPVRVRAFAVLGAAPPPDEREREVARTVFGIPPGEQALALVGGWWPHKDIPTVAAALGLIDRPVHLLVAGHPLDAALLKEIGALWHVRLHVLERRAEEAEVRAVYAAADLALVSRRRAVAKESGLVVDAVRHHIPLLASDHDPDLTRALDGCGWARLFTAEDPEDLAHALDTAHLKAPRRPGPADARALGLPTAREQAAHLADTWTRLTAEGDPKR